ncbi:hypothetical protein L7F22_005985 [Adiantum nelumboides]|nr:hypothetical protein [Adiantum nelumboides]
MSQEQPERPVTYKDVFGDAVQGEVAAQPVTIEDAALMQSAETIGLGKTPRGGAASLMQSAADKNVRDHIVDPVSHSDAAERGFGLRETIVDGKVCRQEFVGQQPVAEETTYVPTLSEIAATQGMTIGEALEEAALNDPDKIVDKETARAIQSAEARATGIPLGFKGGLGATAQSAAQKNADRGEHITLSDVLEDATERMIDKVVTQEDVQKVKHVVAGDENTVIVSALQGAVDANSNAERYLEAQEEKEVEALPSPPKHELTPGEVPSQEGPMHPHAD